MNSNSQNPSVGKAFQKLVAIKLADEYGKSFELEHKIPIGKGEEKKEHAFDIVSVDHTVAVECKCYSWTETGNVPSAKMGFTNEAAFYLSFLPDTFEKIIVMKRSTHPKRHETLAEYYYRTYKHLLGNIKVAEYDGDCEYRIIN